LRSASQLVAAILLIAAAALGAVLLPRALSFISSMVQGGTTLTAVGGEAQPIPGSTVVVVRVDITKKGPSHVTSLSASYSDGTTRGSCSLINAADYLNNPAAPSSFQLYMYCGLSSQPQGIAITISYSTNDVPGTRYTSVIVPVRWQ